MEPVSSTDYTYTTATSSADTESSDKEPKAPEGTLLRKVQDAKESILVLKNQVSFAEQCLSLLHNQMKHASDTLAILQDQVELAQKTVNSLTAGSVAGLAIPQPQTTAASSTSSRGETSWSSTSPSDSNEQQVIVHDSEGPKVYTLSKSNISLGNSDWSASHEHGQAPRVVHQVQMHCHCPACVSHAAMSAPMPCHPSCHAPPGAVLVEIGPDMKQSSHCTSVLGPEKAIVQARSSFPSPNSKSTQSLETSKDNSSDKQILEKKESASTSPMAHQLLQVIDVLQTVDDDDGKANQASHVSLSHGTPVPEGFPYVQGTASYHRTSRRSRKQNMSPVKVVCSHSTSQDRSSSGRPTIREHPELMRVPPPVLASSLEPEFLVVPTSSYSYDSPPASVSSQVGKDEIKKSSEILLDKRKISTPSQDAKNSVTAVSDVGNAVEPREGQGKRKGSLEMGEADSCCSSNITKPRENTAQSSSIASSLNNQQTDVIVDLNGLSSSPLSPKKRFTGTSPLNSDMGVPFLSKVQSLSPHKTPSHRNDSVVISVHSATQPVSVATVVSPIEHSKEVSSVTSTSNHVTGSQSAPVTVISLSSSGETSAVPGKKITTPTSKKPIILSRRSSQSGEQNIPQGLVVLVPTIEDAKRLIASSGVQSDGHTPVLVPQHMLSEVHSKRIVTEDQLEAHPQLLGKRSRDGASPTCGTQSKRPAFDSIIIE